MSGRTIRRSLTRHAWAALVPAIFSAGLPAGTAAAQGSDTYVNRTVGGVPIHPRRADRKSEPSANLDAAGATVGVGGEARALLKTPLSHVFPGEAPPDDSLHNPAADDPGAAYRGMSYFNQFNCVGCHAPNGAGGMGPSLSDNVFVYGGEPANIYLTILQGRPAGMPAFGWMLPDNVIWDLVAYVRSISNAPKDGWGRTIALDDYKIEQVPAAYMTTVNPWSNTQPFSFGMPPFKKVKRPVQTSKDAAPAPAEGGK